MLGKMTCKYVVIISSGEETLRSGLEREEGQQREEKGGREA